VIVSVDFVREHLSDPGVVIADVRWYLDGRRGIDAFAKGHIPGAQFVDVDRELAAPPGAHGRHPLPAPDDFARVLSRLGVTPASTVVAYDDAGGAIAARLWWLLRWVGLDNGRVLDGGIGAWVAAGGELETVTRPREAAPLMTLEPRRDLVADIDEVARGDALLLDARAPERYRGEHEPIDPRAGHIPGAKNAPFAENLRDGRFRPPAELRARYEALGADRADIVCYCGSGVTAAHDVLALELAGFPGARLYPGSWSEWASDPDRPIATDS
jgi:thiosulfate/3-mercaptopyruvate sulfurtransferase